MINDSPRRSWRAAAVVSATALTVVAAGWALSSEESPKATNPIKPTDVAADYADIAGWKQSVVGNLLPIFVDDAAMKNGGYLANRTAELCAALVRDTVKAMNNSRPAPDDQLQKHFVAMLTSYKEAGDKCVAGDAGGSYTALQAAEKEQQAMGVKK